MTDSGETVDPLPLLDELRATAQTGLNYADDPYEEERYERMLELVDTYAVEPPGDFPHYSISHVYLCDRVGEEPTTTYESRQTRYLPVEEVPEWALDYYREAVREALVLHSDR